MFWPNVGKPKKRRGFRKEKSYCPLLSFCTASFASLFWSNAMFWPNVDKVRKVRYFCKNSARCPLWSFYAASVAEWQLSLQRPHLVLPKWRNSEILACLIGNSEPSTGSFDDTSGVSTVFGTTKWTGGTLPLSVLHSKCTAHVHIYVHEGLVSLFPRSNPATNCNCNSSSDHQGLLVTF